MTTIKEEFENFTAKCGNAEDKILGFAILGSNLNILREAVAELNDDIILGAFDELIELIEIKSNELANTVIKE